jgi:hypothetical protein
LTIYIAVVVVDDADLAVAGVVRAEDDLGTPLVLDWNLLPSGRALPTRSWINFSFDLLLIQ